MFTPPNVIENSLVFSGDIADSHGPDNTVMVELITNPMRLLIGNGKCKPAI